MLKYIELKTNRDDHGPAWIARVKLSKSKLTVYFGDKALFRLRKGGASGNHGGPGPDGEFAEYWVSNVKKNGCDRHWAGSGVVMIERSAVEEYLRETGAKKLDLKRLKVIDDLPDPDPSNFVEKENNKLTP